MTVSSMRVLVTGGAGLIGSHLCERLLAAGHEVWCIDNYFTGNDRNMQSVLENPRFKVLRNDITEPLGDDTPTVEAIFNLACPAVQPQPETYWGCVNPIGPRSYPYVDDTVDGLLLLMASPEDFCGLVNIGNPEEFTLRELAETILELTGSQSEIRYLPAAVDDSKRRQADVTLARTKLGWQPRMKHRDGLARTVEYFRALR